LKDDDFFHKNIATFSIPGKQKSGVFYLFFACIFRLILIQFCANKRIRDEVQIAILRRVADQPEKKVATHSGHTHAIPPAAQKIDGT
jgi:hypothetical protein